MVDGNVPMSGDPVSQMIDTTGAGAGNEASVPRQSSAAAKPNPLSSDDPVLACCFAYHDIYLHADLRNKRKRPANKFMESLKDADFQGLTAYGIRRGDLSRTYMQIKFESILGGPEQFRKTKNTQLSRLWQHPNALEVLALYYCTDQTEGFVKKVKTYLSKTKPSLENAEAKFAEELPKEFPHDDNVTSAYAMTLDAQKPLFLDNSQNRHHLSKGIQKLEAFADAIPGLESTNDNVHVALPLQETHNTIEKILEPFANQDSLADFGYLDGNDFADKGYIRLLAKNFTKVFTDEYFLQQTVCPNGWSLQVPTYILKLGQLGQRLMIRKTVRASLAQLFACLSTRNYFIINNSFGLIPRLTAPIPRKVSDVLMRMSREGTHNYVPRCIPPCDVELEKLGRNQAPYKVKFKVVPQNHVMERQECIYINPVVQGTFMFKDSEKNGFRSGDHFALNQAISRAKFSLDPSNLQGNDTQLLATHYKEKAYTEESKLDLRHSFKYASSHGTQNHRNMNSLILALNDFAGLPILSTAEDLLYLYACGGGLFDLEQKIAYWNGGIDLKANHPILFVPAIMNKSNAPGDAMISFCKLSPLSSKLITLATRYRSFLSLLLSVHVPTSRAIMRISYVPLEHSEPFLSALWVTVFSTSEGWYIRDHWGKHIRLVDDGVQDSQDFIFLMRGCTNLTLYCGYTWSLEQQKQGQTFFESVRQFDRCHRLIIRNAGDQGMAVMYAPTPAVNPDDDFFQSLLSFLKTKLKDNAKAQHLAQLYYASFTFVPKELELSQVSLANMQAQAETSTVFNIASSALAIKNIQMEQLEDDGDDKPEEQEQHVHAPKPDNARGDRKIPVYDDALVDYALSCYSIQTATEGETSLKENDQVEESKDGQHIANLLTNQVISLPQAPDEEDDDDMYDPTKEGETKLSQFSSGIANRQKSERLAQSKKDQAKVNRDQNEEAADVPPE